MGFMSVLGSSMELPWVLVGDQVLPQPNPGAQLSTEIGYGTDPVPGTQVPPAQSMGAGWGQPQSHCMPSSNTIEI